MNASQGNGPVQLRDLLSGVTSCEVEGAPATEAALAVAVTGVQHDSRRVQPGDLFVAIRGERFDGTRFVDTAVAAGAVAVLTDTHLAVKDAAGRGVPVLVAENPRRAMAPIAELVYGAPSSRLRVVGLTGTNGKTTCAWLLSQVLTALGRAPAVLGTVSFRGPGFDEPAPFTTPESNEVSRLAQRAVQAGATELVMEVSSHGLALGRVDAVQFEVAAFTNLTQDHLDFHETMAAYGDAKTRLFRDLAPKHAVLHVGDPFVRDLATRLAQEGALATDQLLCFAANESDVPPSLHDGALWVEDVAQSATGMRVRVRHGHETYGFASPLIGAHNLENLLLVFGCALRLGHAPADVASALTQASGAPGRLERVPNHLDLTVLVDYAHTPDALARALDAVRPVTDGRVIAVFGCGGDRDRGKRPLMGRAAAERADLCVVTSDNPRTEDPENILDDVMPGFDDLSEAMPLVSAESLRAERTMRAHVREVDRATAIALALEVAAPGDTVLIAGKGHEDYQIIGTEKRPFDDRKVAREAVLRIERGRR